jgi:hypothetical protein
LNFQLEKKTTEPQNWESIKEKLLEEICFERSKLKTQMDRYERLNLELEAKNLQIAQMDKELAAKNEVKSKIFFERN